MKDERGLSSLDQSDKPLNKPVNENGDFENQKDKDPKKGTLKNTGRSKSGGKKGIYGEDGTDSNTPERKKIGFKQKDNTEPKSSSAPKTEKADGKHIQKQSAVEPKIQKANQESKPQHKIIGSRKKRGEPGLSSAHVGPKGSLEPYDRNSVDSVKSTELSQEKRTDKENPIQIIRAQDDGQVDDFFVLDNKKEVKHKEGFARTPKSRRKPDSSFDPAILDKILELPTNMEETGAVKKARSIVNKINQGSIQKPSDSSERKLVWPLKSRTTDSTESNVIKKSQSEKFLENKIIEIEKEKNPKLASTLRILKIELAKEQKKSFDETLNEIESKARASIKENADKIADKALKGNQEEIDASTIRINQHSALKDNIKKLQEMRDTVTTSNDQSFEGKLVNQIDTKISELKNLSPYKSQKKEDTETQKHENTEPKAESLKLKETPNTESSGTKTKTVNESFARDEKNQNDAFNPREKTIGEAYEDGSIEKKPEIVSDGKYELLVEKRNKYIEAKNSELSSHRETQGKLNSIRKFFALFSTGKKFNESYETQKLHSEYLNERVAYGKNLREEKKSELARKVASSEVRAEDALDLLDKYTEGELFEKIIIEEQETIKSLELKKSPTKTQKLVEKALGGMSQLKEAYKQSTPEAIQKILGNRYSRTVALGLFWSAVSFASIPSAVGRIAGSLIGGTGAVAVGKGIDKIGDSLINSKSVSMEKATKGQFEVEMVTGLDNDSLQKVIARYEKNKKFESNARKIKTITKLLAQTGTAIALGRGASTAISDFVNSDQFITPKDTIFDAVKKADLVKNAVEQNALHEIKTSVSGAIKNVGEIGNELPGKANEIKESLKEFFENTKESGGELLDKAKDNVGGIKNTIYEAGQTIESAKIVGRQATENFLKETGEKIFSLKDQPIGYDPSSELPPPNISLDTPYTPIEKLIPADSISPIPDTVETLPPPDAIKIGGGESGQLEPVDTTTIKSPITENLRDSIIAPKDTVLTDIPSEPKITTPGPATIPKIESVSVEANKLGAIETFKDLKEKLARIYPDIKLAPANAREILESDETELSIKYGFYNPPQSAMLLKGEEIGLDTKGNLFFKDANGTVDYLKQGDGYDGKMFDNIPDKTPPTLEENPYKNITPKNPSDGIPLEENPYKNVVPAKPETGDVGPEKNPYADVVPKKPEINLRGNTYYSPDPEIDAMTPRNSVQVSPRTPETPTTRELLNALDAKGVHTLAEKEFTKDIDSIFQKPNFLLGGATKGTQTEEWMRTLEFMDSKKVTGNQLFEAMDANMLQNTDQGEFFTLGEYVRSLKNNTGLMPNEGELLKDYILRANEYKIEHKINSEDMLKIIDDAEKQGRLNIDEPTRNKIRARRSVGDDDGVYN